MAKSHLIAALFLCGAIGASFAVTSKDDLAATPQQREILVMFRELMGERLYLDHMKKDAYLLRWLREKDFDMKEAEKLLEENLRWRKENGMDTIHQEDWSDMIKHYPYHIEGEDTEGRPIGTVSIGTWDIRRAVQQGKMPRLQRYMDKLLDEISLKVVDLQSQGKNVTRWVLLTNVEGFNVIQHACPSCTSLWANFLRSYESHYPNTANSIYAINAPESFNLVLRLLQPSIPKTSRETIKIFNHNKAEWMAFLDKTIPRDQRSREYGGNKD